MTDQLLRSGCDESYDSGHIAAGLESADEEALKAFVNDVEDGDYDNGDAENLAVVVETVQAVLETTAPAASATEPTPPPAKWADAAGHSGQATDTASTAVPSHPIDRIELPDAVDPTAAQAAYDAVVEFLIAAGPATDGEIVMSVMPEQSLGYTPPSATDSKAGVWWHKVIEPALAADATVSYDPTGGYVLGGRLL